MPDGEQVAGLIRKRFPDAVVGAGEYRQQHWLELKAEHLVDVCRWLRDDPAASFDFLVDVTAVHWPDDPQPVETVYHLFSYARNDRLQLKVRGAARGLTLRRSRVDKNSLGPTRRRAVIRPSKRLM